MWKSFQRWWCQPKKEIYLGVSFNISKHPLGIMPRTTHPILLQELTLMWRQTGTWDPWAKYSNTCPWTNISLSYKLQIHSMGLKTTCTVGANYRQKIKTTTKKNPIATSEELRTKTKAGCQEQKQGTVHSPCTQHHLRSGQNT